MHALTVASDQPQDARNHEGRKTARGPDVGLRQGALYCTDCTRHALPLTQHST